MLQLSCSDMGFECKTIFVAKTESELQEQIRSHAGEIHGVEPSDFTPELARKLKENTRRV